MLTHAHMRGRRALVVLFAAVLSSLALWAASPAHGHDVLVDHSPADGAVLDEAPDDIVLTFNNEVLDMGAEATVVRVTDASGQDIETDPPSVQNRDVVTRLHDLPDGAYRVVWRVVSSDGHPIQGTFTFAVGPDAEAALDALPAIGDPVDDGQDAAADSETDEGVSLPVIIGVGVVVVGLAVAAIVVLARRKRTS